MNLARQLNGFEEAVTAPCRLRPRLDLLPLAAPKPTHASGRCGVAMVVLDREGFLHLRRVLPAATKDCLRDTFGVSETTWVKLRDGRPIKKITLERLLARYSKIVESRAGLASVATPSARRAGGPIHD